MKYIILLSLICNLGIAQSGKVYETYKTTGGGTNQSDGTIFTKPFQEYNYIKTHRGIEVYSTYKTRGNGTNESHGTIFSKPFPEYIIIGDKMYKTYKTESRGTNESRGTIFTRPFESKDIQADKIKYVVQTQAVSRSSFKKDNGPTYDGETYSSGDGE